MSDDILVELLKEWSDEGVPDIHSVPLLRGFFGGLKKRRMARLLRETFDETMPSDEATLGVKRWMELLEGVLEVRHFRRAEFGEVNL